MLKVLLYLLWMLSFTLMIVCTGLFVQGVIRDDPGDGYISKFVLNTFPTSEEVGMGGLFNYGMIVPGSLFFVGSTVCGFFLYKKRQSLVFICLSALTFLSIFVLLAFR